MYSPPTWTCDRCSTSNATTSRYCTTCGQPNRDSASTASGQRPWWRYKRVWLIALTGWLFAAINCVAFTVVALNSGNETTVDELLTLEPHDANSCEDVLVWQLLALENGDTQMIFEATNRGLELGCQ